MSATVKVGPYPFSVYVVYQMVAGPLYRDGDEAQPGVNVKLREIAYLAANLPTDYTIGDLRRAWLGAEVAR